MDSSPSGTTLDKWNCCSKCQAQIQFVYPGKKTPIHDPMSGRLLCGECRARLPTNLPGPLFSQQGRVALPLCLLRQYRVRQHAIGGELEVERGKHKVPGICNDCSNTVKIGTKRGRDEETSRKEEAIVFCNQCSVYICNSHRSIHPSDHPLSHVENMEPSSDAPVNLADRCVKHHEKDLELVNIKSLQAVCTGCVKRSSQEKRLSLGSAAPILRSRIASAFIMPLRWKRDNLRLTTESNLPGLFGAVQGMEGVIAELGLCMIRAEEMKGKLQQILEPWNKRFLPRPFLGDLVNRWTIDVQEIVTLCQAQFVTSIQSRTALVGTLLEAMSMLGIEAEGLVKAKRKEKKNVAKILSHLSTRPINNETIGEELLVLKTLEGVREILEYGDPLLLGMNGDEIGALFWGPQGISKGLTTISDIFDAIRRLGEHGGDQDKDEERKGGLTQENTTHGKDGKNRLLIRSDEDIRNSLEFIKEEMLRMKTEFEEMRKPTYWLIKLSSIKAEARGLKGEEDFAPDIVRIALDLTVGKPRLLENLTSTSNKIRVAAKETGHPDGLLAYALPYYAISDQEGYGRLLEAKAKGCKHPALYCVLGNIYQRDTEREITVTPKTPDINRAVKYYNKAIAAGYTDVYKDLFTLLGQKCHKRQAAYINDLYAQGLVDPVVIMDLTRRIEGEWKRYYATSAFLTGVPLEDWIRQYYMERLTSGPEDIEEIVSMYLNPKKNLNEKENAAQDARMLVKTLDWEWVGPHLRQSPLLQKVTLSSAVRAILITHRSSAGYLLMADMRGYAATPRGLAIMLQADKEELAVPKIYAELASAYLNGTACVTRNGTKALEYATKLRDVSLSPMDRCKASEIMATVYANGIPPEEKVELLADRHHYEAAYYRSLIDTKELSNESHTVLAYQLHEDFFAFRGAVSAKAEEKRVAKWQAAQRLEEESEESDAGDQRDSDSDYYPSDDDWEDD